MNASIVSLIALSAALIGTAIGEIVSDEIRGRLDRMPKMLLRLAALRVPADVRDDLLDEWTAEVNEILRGAEALPVTRLVRGAAFAMGLIRTSRSIGRTISSLNVKNRALGGSPALSGVGQTISIVPSRDGTVWRAFMMLPGLERTVLNAVATDPEASDDSIAQMLGLPSSTFLHVRDHALELLKTNCVKLMIEEATALQLGRGEPRSNPV